MPPNVIQSIKYFESVLKSGYRYPLCFWNQGWRQYGRWRKSFSAEDNFLWIPFQAQDFAGKIINAEWKVFEYGSGKSSLFYSRRVKQLISVEHDKNYYEECRQSLQKEGIKNCDLRLIIPEHNDIQNQDWSNPEQYCSAAKEFRGSVFRQYVQAIDSFPDDFFDLVAIDGRARPSCILHARQKVKKGGWLLLDDSERTYYSKAKLLLKDWEKQSFYGPGPNLTIFWETTFWKKPEKTL